MNNPSETVVVRKNTLIALCQQSRCMGAACIFMTLLTFAVFFVDLFSKELSLMNFYVLMVAVQFAVIAFFFGNTSRILNLIST